MFDIRIVTPSLINEDGWPQAGAALCLGNERFTFVVDLRHWTIVDYTRQWLDGVKRILHGGRSSALMTSYGGPAGHMHHMWGMWRDEDWMYLQQHAVTNGDLEDPFRPENPYSHVGERIATSKYELPIPEWRVDLVEIYAAALNIQWPLFRSLS